jgi:hypothetical protein
MRRFQLFTSAIEGISARSTAQEKVRWDAYNSHLERVIADMFQRHETAMVRVQTEHTVVPKGWEKFTLIP